MRSPEHGRRSSSDDTGELSEEQKRDNLIRLAFDNDASKLDRFVQLIKDAIPAQTAVVVRGSAVTGERWKDGAGFDADGPGTSDLDLTLVGDRVVSLFNATGFFVPAIHSRPLSDDDPDIAPDLVPLRQQLIRMVAPAREHPGHSRLRDVSARRVARAAVPYAGRQAG